jgi:tetratricopeptide (TPR) repeat protein
MTPEAVQRVEKAIDIGAAPAVKRTARARWGVLGGAALVLVLLVGGGFLWLRHADPDAIWKAAEVDLNEGRIDQADAASSRLARLREPTPLDWMLQAQVDLARERVDDALAALARIPDGHRAAPQARLMAGQTELRRHRARFAEQLLREAIRLDPGQAAAHRELIYILGYQLRREELAAEFQALGEVSDLTYDNVFHWCLLRSALWDPDTAVEELALFIQTDPEDRWSRLALADNYRRMTRLDEVEGVLAPLPASDPRARVIRVMAAMDRHQEDKAEELLNTGPEDDPYLAQLKGRLALARRDGATAVRCFRIAYHGLPDDRDALFGLINALTLQGDDKSAAPLREILKRQEVLNSLIQRASTTSQRQNVELLRELGAACAALSRVPEARAWYKLAIAHDPLDTQAQQALFQLDQRSRPAHPSPPRQNQTPPG